MLINDRYCRTCEDHEEEVDDQEAGGTAGQVELDAPLILDITGQEDSPD